MLTIAFIQYRTLNQPCVTHTRTHVHARGVKTAGARIYSSGLYPNNKDQAPRFLNLFHTHSAEHEIDPAHLYY